MVHDLKGLTTMAKRPHVIIDLSDHEGEITVSDEYMAANEGLTWSLFGSIKYYDGDPDEDYDLEATSYNMTDVWLMKESFDTYGKGHVLRVYTDELSDYLTGHSARALLKKLVAVPDEHVINTFIE
tara:strand:+ start:4870 stop:5247 length:378 start_codon:yes stop_codon:yes gene_type:complete